MQFLKTLFWVVLAVVAVLFAKANWTDAELRLWGGLIADVKLPILLLVFFLIGFLPTLILYRARIWALKRRYEPIERSAPAAAVPAPPPPAPETIATATNGPAAPAEQEERVATDTKIWPSA